MKTSQLKIMFFMLMMTAALPLFAQGGGQGGDLGALGLGGVGTLAKTVQDIFTGDLVRIILVCCLAGCGVAYGFNKDNEKMKRNIIAIAIAIGIITAAATIVDTIFSKAG